jgi:neopullulanase
MRVNTFGRQLLTQAVITLCALFGMHASAFAAIEITRVEPPNWWIGMHDASVQLMMHGPNIAQAQLSVSRTDVQLLRVSRQTSDNYLFVELAIATDAKPGPLVIRLTRGSETLNYSYALLARETGSAVRQGFDNRDVILNLMPDRFANGAPDNDQPPGMLETAKPEQPGARQGGDLRGMAQHLDYIARMGFTAIWPTPLMENNQQEYSYHGYAATDLYKIDARFGSNEDYRQLVYKARRSGISVIQDVVLNHIGDGHWWMRDLPGADWLTNRGSFAPTNHARTTLFDPYAAHVDKAAFTRGWFVPTMPDLNQRNPMLARYLIQNTLWWVEYSGITGLRVDTFGYSDTAFLSQWTQAVRAEYPGLSMVGEEWSTNPVVVARWQQDHVQWQGAQQGMPNMMDFPLAERLRRALVAPELEGQGLEALYTELANDPVYPDASKLVLFEGNHDMPRLYSVLDEDLDLYRMALVYVATMPRIPQFYYGTEVLMTSPKARDDSAIRRPFPGGWPGDAANAFNGKGLSPAQSQAQRFVRTLLNWRKSAPAVHTGATLHFLPQDGVYVYFRHLPSQRIMVILNKNAAPTRLALARFAEGIAGAKNATEALSNRKMALGDGLTLPARSASILVLR